MQDRESNDQGRAEKIVARWRQKKNLTRLLPTPKREDGPRPQ